MKHILITGAAGFIGVALIQRLLSEDNDYFIVGIDNLNNYYDAGLKNIGWWILKPWRIGKILMRIAGDLFWRYESI